jgi:DNA polymerase-3 subunit gamma/tau
VQAVAAATVEEDAMMRRFADSLAPETVQLFYQIVLLGLRDLELAPDPRCGFEMVMLRLLAFEPLDPDRVSHTPSQIRVEDANGRDGAQRKRKVEPPRSGPVAAARAPTLGDDWYLTAGALELGGVARMIVENAYPLERNGDRWVICLDRRHDTLLNDAQTKTIERALGAFMGRPQQITIITGDPPHETPAVRTARETHEQHEQAVASLRDDANVRALVLEFGAELKVDSVRPVKRQ